MSDLDKLSSGALKKLIGASLKKLKKLKGKIPSQRAMRKKWKSLKGRVKLAEHVYEPHVTGIDSSSFVSMHYIDPTTLNCKYKSFDQMGEKLAQSKSDTAKALSADEKLLESDSHYRRWKSNPKHLRIQQDEGQYKNRRLAQIVRSRMKDRAKTLARSRQTRQGT